MLFVPTICSRLGARPPILHAFRTFKRPLLAGDENRSYTSFGTRINEDRIETNQ